MTIVFNIEKNDTFVLIREKIKNDQRLTVREGTNKVSVFFLRSLLTDELIVKIVSVKFVIKLLTVDQMKNRIKVWLELKNHICNH